MRVHPRLSATLLGALLLSAVGLPAGAQDPIKTPDFRRVVIDPQPPSQPYYKLVGDVTGDGRPEIVVAGRTGPIVMYAAPDWKRTLIAEGGFRGGVSGELADINGDGRLDIVMGGVVWFENPGRPDGKWNVHPIDTQNIHDAVTGDLDGDGRLDVVCRDQSAFGRRGNAIFIYYQHAPGAWTKETIDCPHGEGLTVADVDGDGQPDVVIGGRWFRRESGRWSEHVFAAEWTEPDTKVAVGDINGDGRDDIVLTPAELKGERYRISWFQSPAGSPAEPWKEQVVVPDIECVIHSLALGDFNADGRLDIAYAEMHQGTPPNEVVVMLNGGGSTWQKRVIDRDGSHDIRAADLNGDGALDIVGANHAGVAPLVLWENRR